ncbi:MAG: type II secretion system secretin GspD [Desulfuromonadales bacterium]|nr:type II secretion system secretin GspD [Desulfuromonadales bacterium]
MSNQILRMGLSILLIPLLLLGFGGDPAHAAEPQKPLVQKGAGNRVTLDFREIELTDLIQTISELTGKNFLYDDTVKGKVTVVSPEEMTIDEAYQLFQTVLGVKGFTVVPSGKVNKIVPVKGAKESNLPIVTDEQKPTEQYITRLLRLENLDAATIADNVLAPLIPATGNVVVYSPTNTLLITDSAANIERLVKIIKELDQPGSARVLEVVSLQHAGAEDVAKICTEVLTQGSPTAARRSRTEGGSATADFSPPKILAYARANALIVMASPEQLATIKDLVAKMDRDTGGGYSSVNVYPLENADAESLAKTMNEILTGIRAETRGGGQGKGPVSSGPMTITADKPTNSLIINAKPEDYASLKGIIEKLDVKRKQVYVEALIMELSMDATQKLGVSLQGAASVSNDGLVFGNSNFDNRTLQPKSSDFLLGRAVDGLLAGGFFKPITVTAPDGTEITVPTLSVLIDLSKRDGDVNILSAPRLLTSDNEEAEIIVGSNVPIITSRLTDTGGGNGLAQSVSVERKDVALVLRFTPQVTEGDLVRLNVYQEMTDIVPFSAGLAASVGNPNDVGPSFTKRVLRNTVLAENGKTVVLGGLIGTNINETVSKVPWLGDIPLLGWLFKHKTTTEKKTNLLVFINPTVIRGPEDLARVTSRNRMVADGLMNDRTRSSLPDNYFAPADNKVTAPPVPSAQAASPIPPALPKTAPAPVPDVVVMPSIAPPATPAATPRPSPAPAPAGIIFPTSAPPIIPAAPPKASSAPAPAPAPAATAPAAVPLPAKAATPPPVPTVAPPSTTAPTPAAPQKPTATATPTTTAIPPVSGKATTSPTAAASASGSGSLPRVLDEKWSTPRPQRQPAL